MTVVKKKIPWNKYFIPKRIIDLINYMQTRICEKKQITIHYISYYRDLEFRHF